MSWWWEGCPLQLRSHQGRCAGPAGVGCVGGAEEEHRTAHMAGGSGPGGERRPAPGNRHGGMAQVGGRSAGEQESGAESGLGEEEHQQGHCEADTRTVEVLRGHQGDGLQSAPSREVGRVGTGFRGGPATAMRLVH